MADLKISQLSAATALAGTEVVPVVQSGATKKATIDQILAPAAGKGIDFSANGGDVLTDYDDYVSASTACSGAITTAVVWKITKVGKMVTLHVPDTFGAGTANAAIVIGLQIPTKYCPTNAIWAYVPRVRDNAVEQTVAGLLNVATAGYITLYKNGSIANYTSNAGATSTGFYGFSISWIVS